MMQLIDKEKIKCSENIRKQAFKRSLTYWKSLNNDIESCNNLLRSSLLSDITT